MLKINFVAEMSEEFLVDSISVVFLLPLDVPTEMSIVHTIPFSLCLERFSGYFAKKIVQSQRDILCIDDLKRKFYLFLEAYSSNGIFIERGICCNQTQYVFAEKISLFEELKSWLGFSNKSWSPYICELHHVIVTILNDSHQDVVECYSMFDVDFMNSVIGSLAYIQQSVSISNSKRGSIVLKGITSVENYWITMTICGMHNCKILRVSTRNVILADGKFLENVDCFSAIIQNVTQCLVMLATKNVKTIVVLEDLDRFLSSNIDNSLMNIRKQTLLHTISTIHSLAAKGFSCALIITTCNAKALPSFVCQSVSEVFDVPICSTLQRKKCISKWLSWKLKDQIVSEDHINNLTSMLTGSHLVDLYHAFERYSRQSNDSFERFLFSSSHKEDEVIGLSSIKSRIDECLFWPRLYGQYYESVGLSSQVGILLYGPPGTGKTLLPRILCQKYPSLSFFPVGISNIVRGEVGEGEKAILSIFEAARKQAPSVIFIDEFQAIFTRRNSDSSDGNVGSTLSSTLIGCLDEIATWNQVAGGTYMVNVIASTNAPWAIDSAFLRSNRFESLIFVGPLEEQDRLEFLQSRIEKILFNDKNKNCYYKDKDDNNSDGNLDNPPEDPSVDFQTAKDRLISNLSVDLIPISRNLFQRYTGADMTRLFRVIEDHLSQIPSFSLFCLERQVETILCLLQEIGSRVDMKPTWKEMAEMSNSPSVPTTESNDSKDELLSNDKNDTNSNDGNIKRKRNRWGEVTTPEVLDNSKTPEESEPRKPRRSRWEPIEAVAESTAPSVTAASSLSASPSAPSPESLQHALILKMRLQHINDSLATVAIDAARIEKDPERSPSPPPKYDSQGKRTNTREIRMRDALLKDRMKVIEELLALNPQYQPPIDFIKSKPFRKIYIPYKEFPQHNFIGLIIGPRGNTQKQMENESGCKISIRGKGSVQEGSKGRAGKSTVDDDDELHVHIQGNDEASIEKAAKMIEAILRPTSESIEEHKQKQLRELALINGTLKEDDFCPICGDRGHKMYECPTRLKSFKAAGVKCAICGDLSHPTRDCPLKSDGPVNEIALDNEYNSFLAELDGKGPTQSSSSSSSSSSASLTSTTSLDSLSSASVLNPVKSSTVSMTNTLPKVPGQTVIHAGTLLQPDPYGMYSYSMPVGSWGGMHPSASLYYPPPVSTIPVMPSMTPTSNPYIYCQPIATVTSGPNVVTSHNMSPPPPPPLPPMPQFPPKPQ